MGGPTAPRVPAKCSRMINSETQCQANVTLAEGPLARCKKSISFLDTPPMTGKGLRALNFVCSSGVRSNPNMYRSASKQRAL